LLQTLKELEEQVAYFNYCVVDGSKKMFENRSEVYSKHFIEYCEIHKALSDKVIEIPRKQQYRIDYTTHSPQKREKSIFIKI